MTALCGFWSFQYPGAAASASCDRMLNAQRIYGNAAGRHWDGDEIRVARCPFNILPEDVFDQGPIVGGGGNLVLAADARIDNREDLARRLGISGEQLRQLSDARLLMSCVEKWNDDAVNSVVGDFAFALWNRRDRRLILARDFLGQRPLHYHHSRNFFAFASMPKGLHALPDVPYEPDLAVVADFLALVPEADDRSFFKHVSKVPPGHLIIVTASGLEKRRYWTPDCEPLRLTKAEDYVDAVRETFDRAVEARLRGGKSHVASHLSGGLDSSSVTATAARLLSPNNGRVTAFTSVPEDDVPNTKRAIIDEGPLAAETASLYSNIDHVLIRAGSNSPLQSLDRDFYLYDRPLLNLVNFVWINAIRDEARARGLSVLLTGSMGNMTFSYAGMESLPDLLARGRLRQAGGLMHGLVRGGTPVRTILSQAIGPFLPARLWRGISALRGRGRSVGDYSAIHPRALENLGSQRRAQERGVDLSYRPRRDPVGTRLWAFSRVDFGNYNKGTLGGWGIDNRDPTADQRLVELCLSIPADQFVKDGVPRSLARRAMSDRLPTGVIEQRLKGYQAADWHKGVASARDAFDREVRRVGACAGASEVIDVERLDQLLRDWPASGWHYEKNVLQYRILMLRALSAGHFVRKASGSNE